MSIGDALKFEGFNLKHMFKAIKADPKRIFLGVDPASTWAWNKVLGRNDKPIVNQLGGPTQQTFKDANAAGVNTGTASTLHGIAKGVASAYGAAGLGGIGSGAGGLGTVGSGAYANGAVSGAGLGAGSLGVGAAEALPTVTVTGSAGGAGGLIGAGAAGAGGGAAANGKGFDWQSMVKQGMPGQQQDQQQPQQNPWLAEMQRQEAERKQQELLRQQIAALLAAQQPKTQVLS